MSPRTTILLKALGVCAVIAAVLMAMPVAARVIPPPVAFVVAIAILLPLLVVVQRAWTRYLWARRLAAARERAAKAGNDPEPHVELGVMCSLAGTEAEARAAFERARELAPGHAQATVGLAHLAAEGDDLDRALTLFTEAATAHPDNFAAHYGIGGVQRRREQYARAVLAYERALAIEDDDAFTLAELSRCHLLLGDADKAEEYFLRAAGLGLRDPELEKMIRAAAATPD